MEYIYTYIYIYTDLGAKGVNTRRRKAPLSVLINADESTVSENSPVNSNKSWNIHTNIF